MIIIIYYRRCAQQKISIIIDVSTTYFVSCIIKAKRKRKKGMISKMFHQFLLEGKKAERFISKRTTSTSKVLKSYAPNQREYEKAS